MQIIRIYEIPDCKMVSSGVGMFGDGVLERFMEWYEKQPRGIYPMDFLFWDSSDPEKQGFNWLYVYEEGMDVPNDLKIIDFKGGLYAVANDIDQRTDMDAMRIAVDEFLNENGFERDPSRSDLGNIITTPLIKETLGYDQMDYWAPIKAKAK
ncbi:MAG: AraC family transcriptional regulator [Clostridia bacterium]|nr:AraC family transcriptional regulator [Clostridia bacterium]MBO5299425.1 AraC family transcriptional regulator [Clostridia bacterium]